MRSFVFVFVYITDQFLSLLLPVASGLFAVFAVVFCLLHPATRHAAPPGPRITLTFFALLAAGTIGAVLSGTALTPLFPSTVVLLWGVWWSGARLPRLTRLVTPEAALFGVLFAMLFVVVALSGFDLYSAVRGIPSNRPAGLFLEPSHLAIFVLPLWLIAFMRRSFRPLLLACLVVIAPSQFTVTMAALVLVFAGLRAFITAESIPQTLATLGKVGVVLAVGATIVYLIPDLFVLDGTPLAPYITSRLFGFGALPGDENFGLSPLVVLQGFELVGHSFAASMGLGVGLGNLGTNEAIYSMSGTRDIIKASTADFVDLNLRDGGILVNKLAGEVGVLIVVVAWALIRALIKVRAMPASPGRNFHLICLTIAMTVLFVRAIPYFAAPTCLAMLSLASLVHGGRKLRRRRRRRNTDAAQAPVLSTP